MPQHPDRFKRPCGHGCNYNDKLPRFRRDAATFSRCRRLVAHPTDQHARLRSTSMRRSLRPVRSQHACRQQRAPRRRPVPEPFERAADLAVVRGNEIFQRRVLAGQQEKTGVQIADALVVVPVQPQQALVVLDRFRAAAARLAQRTFDSLLSLLGQAPRPPALRPPVSRRAARHLRPAGRRLPCTVE